MPTIEREVSMGRYHAPEGPSGQDARAPAAPLPGVVLIHDVWGLSEHSRELAAHLAAEGFGVLEIDLYRAMRDVSIEAPGPFIRSLSDPEILADLDAGADWLVAETGAAKVGVMGVCMGGTYALLAACLSDRFSAAAPFYGILSYDAGMLADPSGRNLERKPFSPIEVASRLRMPLLASFGADDEFVPLADVRALEQALGRSGRSWQVDVYEGAGHAFLNRTREAAYREDASSAAWSKVVPFFWSQLAG